jgi:hypothetical protein
MGSEFSLIFPLTIAQPQFDCRYESRNLNRIKFTIKDEDPFMNIELLKFESMDKLYNLKASQ